MAGASAWIERRPARAEHDELLQQRGLIMQYPDLDTPISPLRQRLIDDMNMRRFSRETQRNYLRDIGRLASFLGRSPDTATADDLRRFQIEQQNDGVPVPTMNSIVSA
ncbi:phage integrase N-terminal SAM-like domain-containing protein [Pseudorhizobium flavum]|nr:phage integrase N-terminal SAM-like domain-containing protein [Pseudorhizobium flavum]